MFKIKTAAGLFRIDEQGGFLGFEPYIPVEKAMENISTTEGGQGFSRAGYMFFYKKHKKSCVMGVGGRHKIL